MEKAELAKTVESLEPDERVFLSVYLKAMDLKDNPDYRREMSRRLNDIRDGNGVSSATVKEIHNYLSDKGL